MISPQNQRPLCTLGSEGNRQKNKQFQPSPNPFSSLPLSPMFGSIHVCTSLDQARIEGAMTHTAVKYILTAMGLAKLITKSTWLTGKRDELNLQYDPSRIVGLSIKIRQGLKRINNEI